VPPGRSCILAFLIISFCMVSSTSCICSVCLDKFDYWMAVNLGSEQQCKFYWHTAMTRLYYRQPAIYIAIVFFRLNSLKVQCNLLRHICIFRRRCRVQDPKNWGRNDLGYEPFLWLLDCCSSRYALVGMTLLAHSTQFHFR
jgi:hypothetical protein